MRSLARLSSFVLLSAAIAVAGCQDGPQRPTAPGPDAATSGAGSGAQTVDVVVALDREFAPGTHAENKEEAAEIGGDLGVSVVHTYGTALFGFSGSVAEGRLQALSEDPRVVRVERDFPVHAIAQTLPAGIDRIQADQSATANIDGVDDPMDVDVGIIDTGIDLDHADLDAVDAVNCIDSGATADDDNGHGTHVAGSSAAVDNDTHVVGAAPGARVHAVKVLDSGGSGTISTVICGVDYVTNNAGTIEVANMSLGGQGQSDNLRTAIQNSVQAGVFYAVAAGNDAQDVYGSDGTFGTSDDFIPAAYPEVATVSAMADFDGSAGGDGGSKILTGCGRVFDDHFADCFSNFSQSVVSGNPVTSPGAAIDVAAPGVTVLSTTFDGGTGRKTGTSMSSPHVAGTAALFIVENGRDRDGDGDFDQDDVYSVRQSLIDAGQAQSEWLGGGDTDDPDSNPEPLVQAVFDGSTTNSSPSVSWVNPADGDTVSGTVTIQIDASDNEDDTGTLTVEWRVDDGAWQTATFNSSTGLYEDSWDTSGVSDGSHALDARATDSDGASSTASIGVTVDNTTDDGTTNMHVGDLDSNSINNGPTWTAEVTITVHDPDHNALADAAVTGDWDTGDTSSCTTDSAGQCTVSLSGIQKRVSSVTFTVTDVSHPDFTYDQNDNHDPDGDSDGTSITVQKP